MDPSWVLFSSEFLRGFLPEAVFSSKNPKESEAYTMWFFDTLNPNDAISTLLGRNRSMSCNLHHHKVPIKRDGVEVEVGGWRLAMYFCAFGMGKIYMKTQR